MTAEQLDPDTAAFVRELTKEMNTIESRAADAQAEIDKLKAYIGQLENDNRGLAARLQAIALVMRP